MIGITPVQNQPIILVGPPQAVPSPSTIHVQPVGVYLTEEITASGQRLSVLRHLTEHTAVPTKA